jgi:hypothetical protein
MTEIVCNEFNFYYISLNYLDPKIKKEKIPGESFFTYS